MASQYIIKKYYVKLYLIIHIYILIILFAWLRLGSKLDMPLQIIKETFCFNSTSLATWTLISK